MNQSLEFQQAHLDHVSRSFAFCIRRLPEPLRGWVGLTYLICRILDTVEDSSWTSPEKQNEMFNRLEAAIYDLKACHRLEGWETEFKGLSSGEFLLMKDAKLILQDLHTLPEGVRGSIRDLVLSMSSGMRHFIETRKNGFLRLASLREVNQYCFFVAGLVGEALTQLVASVEPKFPSSSGNLLRAHHFGLFLQKVNILKDQLQDEESGRMLVPSRDQLEDSARSNAKEALEFLCSIPEEQVEFRQFCGWSLFLGLETLIVARAGFWKRVVAKVSRSKTEKLRKQIDDMIIDNRRLKEFFFLEAGKLNWQFGHLTPDVVGSFPDWLTKIYRGQLDKQSLLALGL